MMKRLAFILSVFIFVMICIVCSMRIVQVAAGITAAMLAVRDALNGCFDWAIVLGAFLFIKIVLSVVAARITMANDDQEQAVFIAALFRAFLAVFACTAWAYAGVELQRGRPEWVVVVAVYTVATVILKMIGSDESVDDD